MNLKYSLRQIQTNPRDSRQIPDRLAHGRLPFRWVDDNDHLGTLMPFGAPSTPSCATALRTGRIDAIGLSGVFSQALIPDAERPRAGSPRISRAKCSSNAVSFLALRAADRELIVDVGEDRDVCVDPSRQAAAKLKHGRLIHQRHAVR